MVVNYNNLAMQIIFNKWKTAAQAFYHYQIIIQKKIYTFSF